MATKTNIQGHLQILATKSFETNQILKDLNNKISKEIKLEELYKVLKKDNLKMEDIYIKCDEVKSGEFPNRKEYWFKLQGYYGDFSDFKIFEYKNIYIDQSSGAFEIKNFNVYIDTSYQNNHYLKLTMNRFFPATPAKPIYSNITIDEANLKIIVLESITQKQNLSEVITNNNLGEINDKSEIYIKNKLLELNPKLQINYISIDNIKDNGCLANSLDNGLYVGNVSITYQFVEPPEPGVEIIDRNNINNFTENEIKEMLITDISFLWYAPGSTRVKWIGNYFGMEGEEDKIELSEAIALIKSSGSASYISITGKSK